MHGCIIIFTYMQLFIMYIFLHKTQASPTASTAPKDDSSATQENNLATAVLISTNGAFCTPRIVTRSFTTRCKPSSEAIVNSMKQLAEKGIGHYSVEANSKVYYKPLPTENNKQLIEKYVPVQNYSDVFTNKNVKDINASQFNRLLANSPDERILRDQYEYVDKPI